MFSPIRRSILYLAEVRLVTADLLLCYEGRCPFRVSPATGNLLRGPPTPMKSPGIASGTWAAYTGGTGGVNSTNTRRSGPAPTPVGCATAHRPRQPPRATKGPCPPSGGRRNVRAKHFIPQPLPPQFHRPPSQHRFPSALFTTLYAGIAEGMRNLRIVHRPSTSG